MWEVHALVPGFRIRCKLDFALHGTFWAAAPFAVPALRAKVSGSRKATELRKVASLGQPQLLRFMELAFSVRMHGLRAGCQGTSAISAGTSSAGDFTHSLAPALFAGCDHESCGGLGEVVHFDATAMRAAVSWHTSNRGPILLQLDIFETPSPSFSP